MPRKFVHVCLTPALIHQFDVSKSIVVVIDVLRATTSMCVGFGNGAQLMVPMEEVEECRKWRNQGYLIAGERNGEPIDGFDFGNSPFSFIGPHIKGSKIAITTTNGTRAIKASQALDAKEVVVGAFPNISILADWLIEQNENVCLLCAGWKENLTMEDTIFAGAMAKRLRHHFRRFQDTTLVAETLYNAANKRKRYFFRNSSNFNRLIHLNLQKDVKYALRRDTWPVLPMMVGSELHDISRFKGDLGRIKKQIRVKQDLESKSSLASGNRIANPVKKRKTAKSR